MSLTIDQQLMERVYLSGSEEVSRAASTISHAAGEMVRAAENFEYAVFELKQLMLRFEVALDRHAERLEALGK